MNAFDRTAWHPGACSALELDLRPWRSSLSFIREHQLSKEPLRIDCIVIEKEDGLTIDNDIAAIFRRHNIFEFKSPRDNLDINDFYKVMAYACLYKVQNEQTESIEADQITVSLMRDRKPVSLIKKLQCSGFDTEKVYPGIYYIRHTLFLCQIIVTSELTQEHASLKILSDRARQEDVRTFLSMYTPKSDAADRENMDAVLQVSASANKELFRQIREEESMCEALRELFQDEIDMAHTEGRAEGRAEGRVEGRAEGRMEGRAEGRVEGLSRGMDLLGRLISILSKEKRYSDIEAVAQDADVRERLLKEYKLA